MLDTGGPGCFIVVVIMIWAKQDLSCKQHVDIHISMTMAALFVLVFLVLCTHVDMQSPASSYRPTM